MENTFTKVTETASDAFKSIAEITKERIFTPMYFYFIIPWVITNWKFVYTLLFVNNQVIWDTQGVLKVDYLAQMYGFNLWSIFHLFLIPIFVSYLVVWWFSLVSEKFYQRYEEHQTNKRVIKRKIEYEEKLGYAISEREIREQKFDDKIPLDRNTDFNEWLDEQNDLVKIGEVSMLPSEVLYNTDYKAYQAALEDYVDYQVQKGEDLAVQAEVDRRRGK